MRLLFDQGTPLPLRKYLADHTVLSAFEMSWSELENGELLAAAESDGFDALVTTDQNLRYQQNLSERRIAIIVLLTTNWPRIEKNISLAVDAIANASDGQIRYATLRMCFGRDAYLSQIEHQPAVDVDHLSDGLLSSG